MLQSTVGSVAVGTVLTTGGFVEELTQSILRSMQGIGEGINLENGIKESVKGGGFKTTAGTVVERPALGQQELPYLENKIEQEATKQQTRQRAAKNLNNRRQSLKLRQNELESMTAKREASIAAEEERLKTIMDQEERLRAEGEGSRRQKLAEENESARLQKEAKEVEAARVKAAKDGELRKQTEEARFKQEEETRIKKEAEEARIKKEEKEKETERLRIFEAESKEQARQEAIAREQRALEILRQQEEQRSTASTATAAGVNVLRDYASRFNGDLFFNQISSAVDTEKLQLLLKQLGVSPGIVGGAAALLVFGSGATAIKNVLDEAEENNDVAPSRDVKPKSEEDDLSLQVVKLLEKKREQKAQQPSTVRKTLKISSVEDTESESAAPTQSASALSTGVASNAKPPPSIKFGDNKPQPKVTPPSAKGLPKFSTQIGAKNNGAPSSKTLPNPFGNKMSQSSSSGTNDYGAILPTKKNYSVGSPKQSSFSSSADLPGFGAPPSKNASTAKSITPPKSFGSPPKNVGWSPGKQASSPYGASPKKSSPGNQAASPFSTYVPKAESATAFGISPYKSTKSPGEEKSSPFGTTSQQSASSTKTSFGTSSPPSVGSTKKKSIPPFSPLGKQPPFSKAKTSPFTKGKGPLNAFESSGQTAVVSPNNFELSPKQASRSPFEQGYFPSPPKKQPTPSFGTSPEKGSPGPFGSPTPKSVGSPNSFGSPPKKIAGFPGKQTDSSFGTTSEQDSPGKDLLSPFGTGFSSSFGSPVQTTVKQPAKPTESPFGSSPKFDDVAKKVPSTFAKITTETPISESSYGSSPKQATVNKDQKKPFSPFGQRNGSQSKPKPSFSSSGPVYMPPTSKVNNAASLKNVYSSLDGNQKKTRNDGSQERRLNFEEQNSPAASGPKKSFSPFGGTKRVSKPAFGDSISSGSPPQFLSARDVPTNINDPKASFEISPYGSEPLVSPKNTNPTGNSFAAPPTSSTTTLQNRGVKKSYSPYGRKPPKRAENVPNVDPSSFSFGAPPPKSSSSQASIDPTRTSSFSFGPNDDSASTNFSPNDVTTVSSNRQNYGEASAPTPFAATGFPPSEEDLESAKNRAMQAIRDDEQQNE